MEPGEKQSLSEQDIRTKFITPAIVEQAGWDVQTQVREEVGLTKGRVIVRGKLVSRGRPKRADYVLNHKPNIPIAVVEAKDNNHAVGDGMQQALDYAEMLKLKWFVPADVVWAKLREFILSDPKQAALKIGIPEIANLAAVKPPPPSLPLKHVADFYRDKIDLSETEANRSVRWWDHFRKIVKCQTVRDIEADHIQLYHDSIIGEYRKDKLSPAWVKHRFGKVKTMLSYAMTKGQDQQEISRVLGLCRMLIAPRNRNGVDSDPITRQQVQALLKVADQREKAIILLGLNCAFYPVDISRLPVSAVDLSKRAVIFDRTKTGNPIPRVAILWERTVKAIRAYQKSYSHEATDKDGQPLLFANSEGRQLLKNTVVKWIKNLCDKADCKVVFSQLRDGAYTAVVDAGVDITQAEVLLGHKIGKVKDAYLKRRPSIVADGCQAVEKHYFGRQSHPAMVD